MKMSKSVKAGEVILRSSPFVFLLNSESKTQCCDFCFQRCSVQKCTGCNIDYYCGLKCQKADWKRTHKYECPKLKKIYPEIVSDTPRLVARLLIHLKKGGAKASEKLDEDHTRRFSDLVSHSEKLVQDERGRRQFVSLCHILRQYIGEEYLPTQPQQLLDMYGVLLVNSYTVTDENNVGVGSALYLAASVLDHSCRPDAGATFTGAAVVVTALRHIPDFDIRKARINYIGLVSHRSVRRRQLQLHYHFLCCCERCEDVAEQALEDGLRCGNTDCSGPVPVPSAHDLAPTSSSSSPSVPRSVPGSALPCSLCGYASHPGSVVPQYWEMVRQCTAELYDDVGDPRKCSLEKCKFLLQLQQTLGQEEAGYPVSAVFQETLTSSQTAPYIPIRSTAVSSSSSVNKMTSQTVCKAGHDTPNTVLKVRPLVSCRLSSSVPPSILHPLNVWRVKVLDVSAEAALENENYDECLAYSLANTEGIRHYSGATHFDYGLHLARVGKILQYLDLMEESVKYLCEARDVLRITCASSHSVLKEVMRMLTEAEIDNRRPPA